MLKPYLWLTLWLHVTTRTRVAHAADEREHVHIKVHMPEVVRKHLHQHKVLKHHHHAQSHATTTTTAKQLPRQHPSELDIYAALNGFGGGIGGIVGIGGVGGAAMPQPGLGAIMPEPELAPNYGPALFDNEIYTANEQLPQQQMRLPPAPPTAAASNALPPTTMSRQLLRQQLFTPELMSLLTGGNNAVGYGGAGTGKEAGAETEANKLLAEDFFAELERELARKYAQQRHRRPQRLAQHGKRSEYSNNSSRKPHKRKKYGSTGIGESYGMATQQLQQFFAAPNQSYRDKYQQQQQQQQPYYSDNNNNINANNFGSSAESDEDDFDEFIAIGGSGAAANTNTVYNSNYHLQQQQLEPADDDFDDASSSSEHFMSAWNGVSPLESYQDMFGAYATPTAAALTASQPTIPSRLKWRPYHQQQQTAPEQLAQQQQQPILPAMHIMSAGTPISGITAATLAANDYGQAYKHYRQKRLKHKQRSRPAGQ